MQDLLERIFNSKLTTVALMAGLLVVASLIFGVFGGGGSEEDVASPVRNVARNADDAPRGSSAANAPATAQSDAAPTDRLSGDGTTEAAGETLAQSSVNGADDQSAIAPPAAGGVVAEAAADISAANASPANASPANTSAAGASRAAPAAAPDAPAEPPIANGGPAGANSFNRLMKRPASAPNAPPARDGIHDPSNPGTGLLQWPSAAFEGLPRSSDGNKVDWVKALEEGKIKPRYEIDDPNAEPFLLDLVIVRQVKGSMPNVVYPHYQHTQWLDCSNCHDEIFIPQKGANQISMAGILLGQKCGVCHGKVAFPVSDCRRCHSLPKTEEELQALARRSNWATGGDR